MPTDVTDTQPDPQRPATPFQPVSTRPDFPRMEEATLAWWHERDTMGQYRRRNEGSDKRYSFIDGPITANGPMGVHHAWGRTYKDLFQRFRTMQGYRQRYQNGFDCQGLWVEVEVEKELGLKSKLDIETYGMAGFVEKCKERVRHFAAMQTNQSARLGYWMDWDNSYFTMADENNYTIWHFLKTCWQRGWIYKGHDVMPWCPRCGTGISEHEIATEGYEETTHTTVYARFPLRDRDHEYLLVWTTTPWTLSSNVAAAVHPDLTYVKVRQGEHIYYLAKGTLKTAIKGEHEVLAELPGRDLVGLTYDGPFDDLPATQGVQHRVIPDPQVVETEGTGIVHIAPGCGKEDFALSKEHGLRVIAPINDFGIYVEGFGEFTGMAVAEVNRPVFAALREKGMLLRTESYVHRYPHCWRCHTELVFRLVDEWFISTDGMRQAVQDVTRKIRWLPEFGEDRELDWLRNMGDWMISKKRYWGLALPIYECPACGNFEVIGSETELEQRAVEGWADFAGHTPHRPWIDAVKIACATCGQPVSRITDVGNPWLDAGIVAYSTLDYRHNRAYWEQWFPADFITESFPGQFRNWFYSLLTMSTVLEDREPTRTVLGYGLMRDEKGREMHKSWGNSIEFNEAAAKVGADAMRWVFMNHNPASNLNFGFRTCDEARRQFILPIWNIYSFFIIYANIDGFNPRDHHLPLQERSALDRWILAELNDLVQTTTTALENYDAMAPTQALESFVDNLSNWYLRRSRRRYWKTEMDSDKVAAYLTLYEALTTLTRLLAPYLPYLAEQLYQNLARTQDANAPESVHLCDWPVAEARYEDPELVESTRLALRVVSAGRAARSVHKLKVRQPLARALVHMRTQRERDLVAPLADQISDELNVKVVEFLTTAGEVAEESVKPNLPVLGTALGGRTPRVVAAIKANPSAPELVAAARAGHDATVTVDGEEITLPPDGLFLQLAGKPGYAVAEQGGYLVALPTEISPELRDEGLARELAHRLNTMRKAAGFDIADRITTAYVAGEHAARVLAQHADYVKDETLSHTLRALPSADGAEGYAETVSLDGEEVTFILRR